MEDCSISDKISEICWFCKRGRHEECMKEIPINAKMQNVPRAVIGSTTRSPIAITISSDKSAKRTAAVAITCNTIISTPVVKAKRFSCILFACTFNKLWPSNFETRSDEIEAPRRLIKKRILLVKRIDRTVRPVSTRTANTPNKVA